MCIDAVLCRHVWMFIVCMQSGTGQSFVAFGCQAGSTSYQSGPHKTGIYVLVPRLGIVVIVIITSIWCAIAAYHI